MLARLSMVAVACLALGAQDRTSRLGEYLADEVHRETTAVNDPAVQNYIERLGQRLSPYVPNRQTWHFQVILEDRGGRIHEPLSFPGGYIFVSTQLIIAAQEEAELAGMLAHAMSHRFEPYPLKPELSTVPLSFIDTGNDETALLPGALQPVRRIRELEADRAGLRAMSAAGYDPSALVRYIGRTQSDREERINSLRNAVADLPFGSSLLTDEFHSIRQRVLELDPLPKRSPPTLRRPGER